MYFTFVAPYFRSQMITQRDHDYIVKLDNQKQKDLPDRSPDQCAEVFLNLLTHISKDHTIQYILVLIDDILSVSLEKTTMLYKFRVCPLRLTPVSPCILYRGQINTWNNWWMYIIKHKLFIK